MLMIESRQLFWELDSRGLRYQAQKYNTKTGIATMDVFLSNQYSDRRQIKIPYNRPLNEYHFHVTAYKAALQLKKDNISHLQYCP